MKQKLYTLRGKRKRKRDSKIKGILKTIKENGTTSIEEKMKDLLEKMNLNYIKEAPLKSIKKVKYYDFYVYNEINGIKQFEFLIECHGNYWHPVIFYEDGTEELNTKKKLSKIQKRNIKNDRYKIRLTKRLKIPLLIFYETDINKNITKIQKRIEKEIFNQSSNIIKENK